MNIGFDAVDGNGLRERQHNAFCEGAGGVCMYAIVCFVFRFGRHGIDLVVKKLCINALVDNYFVI